MQLNNGHDYRSGLPQAEPTNQIHIEITQTKKNTRRRAAPGSAVNTTLKKKKHELEKVQGGAQRRDP
jgi:hypothetical protein